MSDLRSVGTVTVVINTTTFMNTPVYRDIVQDLMVEPYHGLYMFLLKDMSLYQTQRSSWFGLKLHEGYRTEAHAEQFVRCVSTVDAVKRRLGVAV